MIFNANGNIVENLSDIRLLVEASNLGSLSAAGRKLGCVRPPRVHVLRN